MARLEGLALLGMEDLGYEDHRVLHEDRLRVLLIRDDTQLDAAVGLLGRLELPSQDSGLLR